MLKIAAGVVIGMLAHHVAMALFGFVAGLLSSQYEDTNAMVGPIAIVVLIAGAMYVKARTDADSRSVHKTQDGVAARTPRQQNTP